MVATASSCARREPFHGLRQIVRFNWAFYGFAGAIVLLAPFGPGFLHFHSRRVWTRCFAAAGLAVHEEFSITPFVRIFVLRRP